MRLGGPVLTEFQDPGEWVAALQARGYRAAYAPKHILGDFAAAKAYRQAAEQADIVIAEVGAWSNPISPNEEDRRRAVALCQERLAFAEEIGARCCVNISGSRGTKAWYAPHADNLTEETFELIVETTRSIIDAVKPVRTCYTLEIMQWAFPDSVDSYTRLLQAIDRSAFAVHLDPCNLISSPRLYFHNADLIRDCFRRLGPYIRSCHAKDVRLKDNIVTVQFEEVIPGTGALDYAAFLRELHKLHPDTPLMLEHLKTEDDYKQAADYIRQVEATL